MKINFVLPDANLGGGTRVIAIYAEKLQKMGHDVFLVSTPRKAAPIKQQIKHFIKNGSFIPRPALGPSHLDQTNLKHHILETERPVQDKDLPDADVVIATWWETAEWVAQLSPQKGAKAYFIQHYEAFDYLPKERVDATWRLPMHKITIAQWLVDLAKDEFGDHDVSLVPNSVDKEQFSAPERSRQSSPTLGMLYSSTHWKGCDIALDAFKKASQNIPGLKLVALSGEARHPALPLPENTEFFQSPPQNQLKDVYARCDGWLFASRVEGFGLPILEAMACRTPVIAVPTGAAPDFVDQTTGLLLKSGEASEMADAITQFFSLSEERWKQMSDAAFTRILAYSWDDAAKDFEKALLKTIKTYR